MTLDLEQIRKNYSEFHDMEIEKIAKNDIESLDPAIVEILMKEIKKRGLDSNLFKGIEAQTQEITEEDLNKIKFKLSNLACPICGLNETPLIGTIIREVKSFLFFTLYSTKPIISCQKCADKKIKNALITTSLLGWWGIPSGIFRTPHAIFSTMNDNKNRKIQSEAIMTNFVISNIVDIKINWDNKQDLVDLLKRNASF